MTMLAIGLVVVGILVLIGQLQNGLPTDILAIISMIGWVLVVIGGLLVISNGR